MHRAINGVQPSKVIRSRGWSLRPHYANTDGRNEICTHPVHAGEQALTKGTDSYFSQDLLIVCGSSTEPLASTG